MSHTYKRRWTLNKFWSACDEAEVEERRKRSSRFRAYRKHRREVSRVSEKDSSFSTIGWSATDFATHNQRKIEVLS